MCVRVCAHLPTSSVETDVGMEMKPRYKDRITHIYEAEVRIEQSEQVSRGSRV